MNVTFGDKVFLKDMFEYSESVLTPQRNFKRFRGQCVRIASLIMERPDNGEIIYEKDGQLYQDSSSKLLPIDYTSYEFFESEIHRIFDKRIEKDNALWEISHEEWYQINRKKLSFEEQMERMEAKNKIEHCPKRYTAMQQLDKALRKETRRDEAYKKKMNDLSEKIKSHELGKEYSLVKLEKEIKPLVV